MSNPMDDEHLIAEWMKETYLLFGATVETAYRVSAMFIEGLKQDLEKPNATV